jgi:glycosyltransferase involved in cell wall biosynthesis
LTIVGDGPSRNELHELSRKLALGDNILFLGERNDVPKLMALADLFVLSSLQEGLSLTLLEAMASGLAVVATDVGGNRELVAPGQTGVLVPSQSPERLAAAILDLLARPDAVRSMGMRGRALVERGFGTREMVRKYESLYLSSFMR